MKTSNEQNQSANPQKTKFSSSPSRSPSPFRKVAGRRYSYASSPSRSYTRTSPLLSSDDGSTGGYHTYSRSPSPFFYEGPSPSYSRSVSPISFDDGSTGGYHTYSWSRSLSLSPSPLLRQHKRVTRRRSPSSSPSYDYPRKKNNSKVLNKRPHPDDNEDDDVGRNKRSSSQVVPCQGHENFASPWSSVEYTKVHGLMVLKRFEPLYHKVYNRYGSIKSTRTEMNKMATEGACTNLLELISDMEMRSVQELDENILRYWEVKISMLEALELNVEWLRKCFDEVAENYERARESKKKIEKKFEKTHESIKKVEEERDRAYKELDQLLADRKEYEAKLRKISGKISEVDEDIAFMNEERAYHNEVLEKEKEKQEEHEVQHRSIVESFF